MTSNNKIAIEIVIATVTESIASAIQFNILNVKRGKQINKQKRSKQCDLDRACEWERATKSSKMHTKYKNKNRFGSESNSLQMKFSNVKCVYKTVQWANDAISMELLFDNCLCKCRMQ